MPSISIGTSSEPDRNLIGTSSELHRNFAEGLPRGKQRIGIARIYEKYT
jgi:hypothetical protein